MNNKYHTNFLLFLLFFLSACSMLPSKEEMEKQLVNFKLPSKPKKNKSMIYVVRPSALGGLIRFNVFLDNKKDSSEKGWNRSMQHIYFSVTPGKHKIYSKAENWAEIDIEVAKGQTKFIKQNTEFGIIMARNSLEHLDELNGKYYVKNTSQGEILTKK
ncbi:MAG: hypothetical protein ISR65_09245 [Bacteriovoracaceae bacterium]|nr:hypothetical protein [Bacteriovoracaceae bacterium]